MASESGSNSERGPVDPTPKVPEITYALNEFAKKVHGTAVKNGWWKDHRDDMHCLNLIHSEVSEATEACRANPDHPCDKFPTISWLEEELSDIIIRVLDFAEYKGCNIGNAVKLKAQYNETRSYRHGGKKF